MIDRLQKSPLPVIASRDFGNLTKSFDKKIRLLFYLSLYLSTVVGNISANISSLVKYERRYVTKCCTHATEN